MHKNSEQLSCLILNPHDNPGDNEISESDLLGDDEQSKYRIPSLIKMKQNADQQKQSDNDASYVQTR